MPGEVVQAVCEGSVTLPSELSGTLLSLQKGSQLVEITRSSSSTTSTSQG